ncbi:hypothetical protein ACQPX6_21385 [Actinomycetospora sp. CA-101289]|uniref:hypothetical protein n=1 Tax=Actinomycetospora sp. CA-101289 TaxID=3239893 RepID=UPI003D9559CA
MTDDTTSTDQQPTSTSPGGDTSPTPPRPTMADGRALYEKRHPRRQSVTGTDGWGTQR